MFVKFPSIPKRWLWLGVLGSAALLLKWRRSQPVPLAGQVVIITGASTGIGRATAFAFAQAGATLVLVARRAEMLAKVQAELAPYGVPVLVMPADVTQDQDLEWLVERVIQQFGRIDILVNNAGVSLGGPLVEQNPAGLHQLVMVNVYGPIRLTQLVLPFMLRRGCGHIVNLSSMAGLIAAPGLSSYSATRSAIITFSDSLRREVDGTGIHISTILPGWTKTEMTDRLDEGEMRAVGMLNPLINFDEPEIPAQAVLEAVRYRRRQVMLGGIEIQAAALQNRLSPRLMDSWYRWFFRLLVNKKRFIKTQQKFGKLIGSSKKE